MFPFAQLTPSGFRAALNCILELDWPQHRIRRCQSITRSATMPKFAVGGTRAT